MSSFERSCLRWPGNKFSLLEKITSLFPTEYINYHEPFLGSASVFLNIENPNIAYLSDSNSSLINFYQQVQNNLSELVNFILDKENSESYYYSERNKIYINPIEQAAQFYYLNRTCFNGIYRVNSLGKFNVPYGFREKLQVLDLPRLLYLNKKLNKVILNSFDFSKSLSYINQDDFIFLDPPYSAKTRNANFNMYNEKLFSWEDQIRLVSLCKSLNERNIMFMMTNLYNKEVYDLFAKELHLNTYITERYSSIGSKPQSRGNYKEYIFTNY